MNKKEIWKHIKGYKYYQASNFGRIKSIARTVTFSRGGLRYKPEKILKTHISDGYKQLAIFRHFKEQKPIEFKRSVHQLVALAFLKRNSEKTQINHIDGNKLNNNVNNLEWVTHSENTKHAYRIGLQNSKHIETPIIQYSSDNKKIREFRSQAEAARHTGINFRTINNSLRGICKSRNGFVWKYKNKPIKKKVIQYSLNGKKIKEYKSQNEAAKKISTAPSLIGRVISGQRKTTSGFKWGYAR